MKAFKIVSVGLLFILSLSLSANNSPKAKTAPSTTQTEVGTSFYGNSIEKNDEKLTANNKKDSCCSKEAATKKCCKSEKKACESKCTKDDKTCKKTCDKKAEKSCCENKK